MRLSFIIPVHNGLAITRACLETLRASLPAGLDHEILFIDDASTDAVADWLAGLDEPGLRVFRHERNQGYAAAINRGAREAAGDLLVLLNSDLEFPPGWLPPLLEAFLSTPRAGIAGTIQLRIDDGSVDHAGIVINAIGKPEHLRPPRWRLRLGPRLLYPPAITAACCLLRRSLFRELGGFHEGFRNGGEDVDFCFQLQARGLRTVVAARSIIRHHVSASPGRKLHDEANSALLTRRHRATLQEHGARLWAASVLRDSVRRPRSLPPGALRAALASLFRPAGAPHPLALRALDLALNREERHWCRLIPDHPPPEMPATTAAPNKRPRPRPPVAFRVTGVFTAPLGADVPAAADRTTRAFSVYPKLDDEYTKARAQGEPGDRPQWLAGLITQNPDDPFIQRLQGFLAGGVWIREKAVFTLPPGLPAGDLFLDGHLWSAEGQPSAGHGPLGLRLTLNGVQTAAFHPLPEGPFTCRLERPLASATEVNELVVDLLGVSRSNTLAFLARILRPVLQPRAAWRWLQHYRRQPRNRRLRLELLRDGDETLFDFSLPASPVNPACLKKHLRVGLNLVGWFRAELGVGESVRLAARACAAADLPVAHVPLQLNCLARQGDHSFDHLLRDENPHPFSVFHLDPAQAGDIDHHHGSGFRKDRYNIAFWAWELPEFPEGWVRFFRFFDEVWTPSTFTSEAIARKSPVPVVTMPHAIEFAPPDPAAVAAFDLPRDRFHFLFMYDLNSYQERKNPAAVIRAFRRAFPDPDAARVGLVIKVHSLRGNEAAFASLREQLADLPGARLIAETLPRARVYALLAACDAFVSLHRSEGFGLAVAEAMFLGKPVISTDWSATAEFVNQSNGFPVRASTIRLTESIGPYARGQEWADPDLDHAAHQMRRCAEDAALRDAVGRAAAATIRERFSPKTIGERYRRRLQTILLWD